MLQIRLLGTPTFILNDQLQDNLFVTRKVKALFIYIMLQNAPCRRNLLATLLWGDSQHNNARNSLRQALTQLQKQFAGYLVIERDTISFNRSKAYWLDVEVLEKTRLAGASFETLEMLLALYRGHFLAGFSVRKALGFEDWLLLERERLEQTYVDCLRQVVDQSLHQQAYRLGLTHIDLLLERIPWDETIHQKKMALLTYSGQRSAALQHYDYYRQALIDEFMVEPSEELKYLYGQIHAGLLEEPNQPTVANDNLEITPTRLLATPLKEGNNHAYIQSMPQVEGFYGREAELTQMQSWLIDDACRLVAIIGLGGQGKTALAAQVCQAPKVIDYFDRIIWQSLINAPPLDILVEEWLQFFDASQLVDQPIHFEGQIALLYDQLRKQRCLLVLDNMESILAVGRAGYKAGYENYGLFIQQVGQTNHQSCLLLTSRERPREVMQLVRETDLVQVLPLAGVDLTVGKQILQAQEIAASNEQVESLLDRYSNNPLALKLISDTIQDLFFGDVAAFLAEDVAIYGEIQDVLDQQLARLSKLEEAILTWLAIEREAVEVQTLWENMYDLHTKQLLLEALDSLKNRALLQLSENGFTLQNVVMEYLSERLIDQVCQEIIDHQPEKLQKFALVKAQGKDYVRQSQLRIFLRPIAALLTARLGMTGLVTRLKSLVSQLQAETMPISGYAAGNYLNLLIYLDVDLRGYDFSNLVIWQAYLQDVKLPEVNFLGSDLTGSVFLVALYQTIALALSADGQYLATAHVLEAVRLWRTEDLALLGSFERGNVSRGSVAFSPDGRWLAGSGQENTIYVWDYQAGITKHILPGHIHSIPVLVFSPDSQILASGSYDTTIHLWDVTTGNRLATLQGHQGIVFSLVFNYDGSQLISAGRDGKIQIWSMEDKSRLHSLNQHVGTVFALATSPDGSRLASGGADRTIVIWRLATRTVEHILPGHNGAVYALAFSPDGQLLVSQGGDATIRVWHLENKRIIQTISTYARFGFSLDFHPTGRYMASCDELYSIRLWDINTGNLLSSQKSPQLHEPDALLIFTPDSQWIISPDYNANMLIWNLQDKTHKIISPSSKSPRYRRHLALSPDGKTLFDAFGTDVRIWGFPEMVLNDTWSMPSIGLWLIAVDNNAEKFAIAEAENKIWIGDIQTKHIERQLIGHTDLVQNMSFCSDGTMLGSSSYDGTIRIWETKTGLCLKTLQIKGGKPHPVLFSPDGQHLITGDDKAMCIWDIHSGKIVRWFAPYNIQRVNIHTFAVNWQKKMVASVAEDFTILLWDYEGGHIIRVLDGHGVSTELLAFSPDNRILATGATDETIRLWDIETGECLTTLKVTDPYVGMNITNTIGLTLSARQTLMQLGAIDQTESDAP